MAEILHDQHDFQGHERIIRIATSANMEEARELLANMRKHSIEIVRLSSETKTKKFRITASEMDTLCAEWQAFRGRIQAYEEEQERQSKATLADAERRAAALGGKITALEGDDDMFDVDFEGRWVHCSMSYVGMHGIIKRLEEIEATIKYGSEEGDDF